MEFKNIHQDLNINCIDDKCRENTNDIFSRMIKTPEISIDDFKSYWELGRRPPISNEKICEFRAISVFKFSSSIEIEQHFRDLQGKCSSVKRNFINQNYYANIKFKKDAGLIKDTSYSLQSPKHFSFFKSDDFTIDKIECIGTGAIYDV